jgi:hypothetical protein
MDLSNRSAVLALAGVLIMGLAACGGSADAETADYEAPQPVAEATDADEANNEMHQGDASSSASAETLVVYKTETCGCCGKWVDHMAENGFEVEVHDVSPKELGALKTARGIDRNLQSCHTAEIGGYLVEGHVPAKDLQRLLAEKPDGVKGIAVPGMPIGSPGMEADDGHVDEYEVVTFDDVGETKVYAWY